MFVSFVITLNSIVTNYLYNTNSVNEAHLANLKILQQFRKFMAKGSFFMKSLEN